MAYVDAEVFANDTATGTLASALGGLSTDTSASLTTGQGALFPSLGTQQRFRIRIDDELIAVTARSGDGLTLVRGIEGTTIASHAAGAPVDAVLTAEAQRRWLSPQVPLPRHHKLLGWTYDPVATGSNNAPAQGVGHYCRISVPETITVSGIGVFLAVSGTSTTAIANAFLGLYSKTGTRLGVSANLSSIFDETTIGYKTATLTADAAGSLTVPGGPDEYCFGALLIGTQSTTPAAFQRAAAGSEPMANVGLAVADPFRFFNLGSSLTALPATITPTTGTAPGRAWWMGLF